MRKKSIKNTRLNSEVQRELSDLIRCEIKDPRIHPMTSVIAVEVTPDLKYAKIFISVLGTEEEKEKTITGLQSASSFLRSKLAKNINLRNTPQLSFVLDSSIEYGVSMMKKINDITHPQENEEERG